MANEHHPSLSPSSFPGLMQCALYRGRGKTEDTELGTSLHDVTERLFKGEMITLESSGLESDEYEKCLWAAQKVREIFDLWAPGAEVHVEKRLTLFDDAGNVITFGTPDFWAISLDGLLFVCPDLKGCLDYRPGQHYYEPQYATYGLMGMRMHGCQDAYCPEINIMPQRAVDYRFTHDEAAAIVKAALMKATSKKRKYNPSYACTHFCGRLLFCPAINKMLHAMRDIFGRELEGVIEYADIMHPDKIEDPLMLARLFTLANIAEKWAKTAINTVKAFSESHDLPYYDRKSKAGRKSVRDVGEAFKLIGADKDSMRMGLTAKEFQACCSASLDDLAETWRAKYGTTKKDARREIDGRLDEVIVSAEPSFSLAFNFKKAPKNERKSEEIQEGTEGTLDEQVADAA